MSLIQYFSKWPLPMMYVTFLHSLLQDLKLYVSWGIYLSNWNSWYINWHDCKQPKDLAIAWSNSWYGILWCSHWSTSMGFILFNWLWGHTIEVWYCWHWKEEVNTKAELIEELQEHSGDSRWNKNVLHSGCEEHLACLLDITTPLKLLTRSWNLWVIYW